MALEYMTSQEAVDYLVANGSPKMNRNNLRQLTKRMTDGHNLMGHTDNGKCKCLVVSHRFGTAYYEKRRIIALSLYKRGEPSSLGEVIREARKNRKSQPVTKKSIGRPTTKAGR